MPSLFGIELHRKPKPISTETIIPKEVVGNFEQYMSQMKQVTGQNDIEILRQTFANPWMGLTIEETSSYLRMDAEAMGKNNDISITKKDPIEECIRLRKNFAPISTCVDYVKQELLGGGLDIVIKDVKDKYQKDMRDDIEQFCANVYQDDLTVSLDILMPIMIDYALTTGVGAAEIAYLTNVDFWEYASLKEPERVTIDSKSVEVIDFDIKEPEWKKLNGIKRLKIFKDGYKLFEPQRDNASMEIKYWSVNEKTGDSVILSNGMKVRKFDSSKPKQGIYLHNWQLFYLTINRTEQGVKGESIILPALTTALILEKILAAVGEGNSRAGFKRFFIIMGSEKRPWGGPFIRNVLQQMKEARDKNWQTIPMPQGFDIKEMGGEVFDAKEVVEYLLKMIAKSMNVPSKVLGVSVGSGTGGIEDNSNYRLWKNNLTSAIRNQLFKRQLYALYGNKRTKQGGGTDNTYIPFARINVEELMVLTERIKLFQDLMNIANPLNPITKMKNEIEFCKVMGWDDVIEELPTLAEYSKELEKQKKAEEKAVVDKAKQDTENAKAQTELAKDPKVDPNIPLGEKRQGAPKPPSEEQLANRQKGGVNIRPVDSKKGIIASKP